MGVVKKKERYVPSGSHKDIMGYHVQWILDGKYEYMPYEECAPAARDYDEWIKDGDDIEDVESGDDLDVGQDEVFTGDAADTETIPHPNTNTNNKQ